MGSTALGLCGLLLCIGVTRADDVCYEDVGCFTTDYPWSDAKRPMPNLPEPPANVGTRLLLHTRNAGEKEVFYNSDDLGDFDPSRKTVIMTHGFNDAGDTRFLVESKDLLLKKGDYNVVIVDWRDGASIPYLQATANTQLVGRQIALLVNKMISAGASAADFHLAGHSLGAHICGYAGNGIEGLGRITGLDPAEPYFEDTDVIVHLDPTDAQYVDIIHSDGRSMAFLGAGFTKANGHVDFFPNDGKNQPGCGDLDAEIEGLIWDLETLDFVAAAGLLGCSHARSHQIFVESLREQSCSFLAFQCADYDEYLAGTCQTMNTATLGLIGLENIDMNLNGSYYLQTTAVNEALCVNYYELTVELNADQEDTVGNMVIVLNGELGSTDRLPAWSDHVDLSAGAERRTTIHTPVSLGALTSVDVTYHDHHGTEQQALSAAALRVSTADRSLQVSTQRFCYTGPPVTDKATVTYQAC
ncbi:pancreatic lipase-related protein 2-like [Amphibalanus amphitrite]|uniref:pancreatic lipase-related protein 2-like n=1 Tax=Amphibalanus amphitrite TaxID=1232801 RepID=UPI001C902F1A|nr:pancreatic lipase-related protein 2-like [Amphibalanus amphitrite]